MVYLTVQSSIYVELIPPDLGTDLNSELSRVVTELESAIHERKQQTGDEVDGVATEMVAGDDDGVEEKALEVGYML